MINAVKLFFSHYNNTAFDVDKLERPRKSNYLPTILSKNINQKNIYLKDKKGANTQQVA